MTDSLDVRREPVEMPSGFRLVLGPPAAVEDAFLGAIAAARARSLLAPIDVLVGGVLLRPYLQRLVADTSPGLLNVRFSTLGELGLRLGEARARRLRAAGRCPRSPSARYTAEVARAMHRLLRSGRRDARASPRPRASSCASFAARASTPDALDTRRARAASSPRRRPTISSPSIAATSTGEPAVRRRGRARSRRPRPLRRDRAPARRRLAARRTTRAGSSRPSPNASRSPSSSRPSGADADEAHAELRSWLLEQGADVEAARRARRRDGARHGSRRGLFAPTGPIDAGRQRRASSPRPTR